MPRPSRCPGGSADHPARHFQKLQHLACICHPLPFCLASRYDRQQHFTLHTDNDASGTAAPGRVLTVLIYLRDVLRGGETLFTGTPQLSATEKAEGGAIGFETMCQSIARQSRTAGGVDGANGMGDNSTTASRTADGAVGEPEPSYLGPAWSFSESSLIHILNHSAFNHSAYDLLLICCSLFDTVSIRCTFRAGPRSRLLRYRGWAMHSCGVLSGPVSE